MLFWQCGAWAGSIRDNAEDNIGLKMKNSKVEWKIWVVVFVFVFVFFLSKIRNEEEGGKLGRYLGKLRGQYCQ